MIVLYSALIEQLEKISKLYKIYAVTKTSCPLLNSSLNEKASNNLNFMVQQL